MDISPYWYVQLKIFSVTVPLRKRGLTTFTGTNVLLLHDVLSSFNCHRRWLPALPTSLSTLILRVVHDVRSGRRFIK